MCVTDQSTISPFTLAAKLCGVFRVLWVGFRSLECPHIEQQQQAAGRKKKALVNLILVV